MRRVATEEAFATRDLIKHWRRALGAPHVETGFRLMGASILGDQPAALAVQERLLDLGSGRISHMDATGIAMQLVSLASPGVQVFDSATGTALAADANDQLSAAITAYPHRLAGLAAIAPQDPASAAREVQRGVTQLGLSGVIVNSHTHGEYLDNPKFWEIFDACQAIGVPLYLHPRDPSPQMIGPYVDYGLYFAGWGFAAETGLHAMRLILSGLFDQFPRLKIVLGHMGEGIPYYLKRIDNRYTLQVKLGAAPKLPRLPSEYFRDNFIITTSGVTEPAVLAFCMTVLGDERILFAADYPYEDVQSAVEFLDSASLTEVQRHAIYCGNADSLFRLTLNPDMRSGRHLPSVVSN